VSQGFHPPVVTRYARRVKPAALIAIAALVAACGGQPASAQPTAASTVAPTISATEPVAAAGTPGPSGNQCTNHEGGANANRCRGPLPAGTYTTYTFEPPLTYTVTEGWANWEDLPGNFLLLPPGATLVGVNPGTSDYLGVYASVVQPGKCTGRPAEGVDQSFDAYVAWLTSNKGLNVTAAKDVTVGGLSGVKVDVTIKPPGDGCPDGVYADVYIGKDPSDLLHGVNPGYFLRLYLLRNASRIVAIEIADAKGGSDYDDWPTAADAVVAQFQFGAP
jgi:hypothetical protein